MGSSSRRLRLRMYRALWGVLHETDGPMTLKEALPKIAKLGYDGVEVPLKFALYFGKSEWESMLRNNGLRCIFQIFTDGPVVPGAAGFCGPAIANSPAPGPSVKEHLAVFQHQVKEAYSMETTDFVNSHSGKDYWRFDEAEQFFSEALEFQKETKSRVVHETHRKRFLHSPWVARDFLGSFLKSHPEMELTADLSHWINIAETDCSDPVLTGVIEELAPRFKHLHCRVGYDHGPQVADPRAPEWLPYTEGHEKWWDAILLAASKAGDEVVTMVPEHGPPNYQPTVPYTREPLASIWDVNHWVAMRQQDRFATMFGAENTSTLISEV